MMNKQKLLIVVVVVLIMLNIATLSFLWLQNDRKPHHLKKRRPDVEHFLSKRLRLSEAQDSAFKEARKEHFDQTKVTMKQLHRDRQKLTKLLAVQDSIDRDNLLESIADKQAQLEKANFIHLQKLRSICTEDQKLVFDSIIFKVVDKGSKFREGMKARTKRK